MYASIKFICFFFRYFNVGVVIPTTPSSSVLQQYNDNPQQQLYYNNLHRQRINRTPDSIGGIAENSVLHRTSNVVENQQLPQQVTSGNTAISNNSTTANVEERINQIQEYIRITSTLINSIQAEKVRYNFFFFWQTFLNDIFGYKKKM